MLSLILPALLSTSACRSEAEPTPVPVKPTVHLEQLTVLDTPTPETTPLPIVAAATGVAPADTVTGTAGARLPASLPTDADAVVVQIGRIAHSPWEPAILAQMSPTFSLQAGGYAVFSHASGPSTDGYYQTALAPSDTLSFVRLLVDEIDVAELARERDADLAFRSNLDGSPAGTESVAIVYVRTADSETRLVMPEDELASSSGPDSAKVARLRSVLETLELWKSGVERPFTEEEKAVLGPVLGWWTELRQPYSPDAAVAFGTRDSVAAPSDAPTLMWPIEPALQEAFDTPFAQPPLEVALIGSDVTAALRAERSRDASFWGPLWNSGRNTARFLVGLRISPPGSNHMVLDYEYRQPPIRLAPPTP